MATQAQAGNRQRSQIHSGAALVVADGHEAVNGHYGKHKSKYPYSEWFDGQTRVVFPRDLGVNYATFRNSLEKAARRRGGRIASEAVKVRSNRTAMKFRFESDEEDDGYDDDEDFEGVEQDAVAVAAQPVRKPFAGPATWPAVGYMG